MAEFHHDVASILAGLYVVSSDGVTVNLAAGLAPA